MMNCDSLIMHDGLCVYKLACWVTAGRIAVSVRSTWIYIYICIELFFIFKKYTCLDRRIQQRS